MDEFKFNPEVELSHSDAASLVAIMVHPGFEVWKKISRSCVDQFVSHMLDANDTEDKEILTRYKIAKVAAHLYTMQLNRMAGVMDEYFHAQDKDKPVDSAQGLEMGLTAQQEIEEHEREEEPIFG